GPRCHYAPDRKEDLTVTLWDLRTGQVCRRFPGPDPETGGVLSVAISPDGKLGLVGSLNVQVWDLTSGQRVQAIRTGGGALHEAVYGAAFTPNSRHVVTAIPGQPLKYWEVATGKLALAFEPGGRPTWYHVAVSADGRQVLGAVRSLLVLWDASTGE